MKLRVNNEKKILWGEEVLKQNDDPKGEKEIQVLEENGEAGDCIENSVPPFNVLGEQQTRNL